MPPFQPTTQRPTSHFILSVLPSGAFQKNFLARTAGITKPEIVWWSGYQKNATHFATATEAIGALMRWVKTDGQYSPSIMGGTVSVTKVTETIVTKTDETVIF